jgi:hypothetical protein
MIGILSPSLKVSYALCITVPCMLTETQRKSNWKHVSSVGKTELICLE